MLDAKKKRRRRIGAVLAALLVILLALLLLRGCGAFGKAGTGTEPGTGAAPNSQEEVRLARLREVLARMPDRMPYPADEWERGAGKRLKAWREGRLSCEYGECGGVFTLPCVQTLKVLPWPPWSFEFVVSGPDGTERARAVVEPGGEFQPDALKGKHEFPGWTVLARAVGGGWQEKFEWGSWNWRPAAVQEAGFLPEGGRVSSEAEMLARHAERIGREFDPAWWAALAKAGAEKIFRPGVSGRQIVSVEPPAFWFFEANVPWWEGSAQGIEVRAVLTGGGIESPARVWFAEVLPGERVAVESAPLPPGTRFTLRDRPRIIVSAGGRETETEAYVVRSVRKKGEGVYEVDHGGYVESYAWPR
jgi:hypothetical protein